MQRDLWPLDPSVLYLNHGSFGACPRAVLDHQARLREVMEREPVDFLWRQLPERLEQARVALAAFVGADPAGLAFVPNATAGVNAVARSLDLAPGDEILTTDHAYAACRKTLEYVATRAGARVVVARVPFPLEGDDDVAAPILAAAGPRTRLAMIDQVTSPTALVFPIERIVRELGERGIDVLVDGAHALGMVPLDLGRMRPAYYTANAHKWLCAPKGAAFLWVREDRRETIHPTQISHGYDPAAGTGRFLAEFDWTGTVDPTPWLTIPECLRYLATLVEGGWPALMQRNRTLALEARRLVGEALGVAPACPDTMIGAMASIPLPAAQPGSPVASLDHEGVMDWLRVRGIEGWLHRWPCAGGKLVRASAQIYNEPADYAALAAALREALVA